MSPFRILLATGMLPHVLAVLRGTPALSARSLSAQHHPPTVAPKQGPNLSNRQLHPPFSEDASEQVFRFRRPLFTDTPVLPHLKLGNGSSSEGLDLHHAAAVQPFPLQFNIQKSSTGRAFALRIALVVVFILVVAGFLSWVLHEEAKADDEHTYGHLEPCKLGDSHTEANFQRRSHPGNHVTFASTHSSARSSLSLPVVAGSNAPLVSPRGSEGLLVRAQDRDSSGQNLLVSRCREILAAHAPKREEEDAASTTRLKQQSMASQPPATPQSSLSRLQVPNSVHMQAPAADEAVVPSMPGSDYAKSDCDGEAYDMVRSERTDRYSVGEVLVNASSCSGSV